MSVYWLIRQVVPFAKVAVKLIEWNPAVARRQVVERLSNRGDLLITSW
jgi:hypothetical protein